MFAFQHYGTDFEPDFILFGKMAIVCGIARVRSNILKFNYVVVFVLFCFSFLI